ncbi:polyphosphate kinase 2 family protein [Granulicella cerasi]|uniref:Polyphosphate kinase 2 family protein n=1 Tax=Granulicella cerasi TaxID=741063 RepID=A0ABW1ZDT4_9BACT|nr:polyphosphate kinase 2 family protein [Granulicella cerasi]
MKIASSFLVKPHDKVKLGSLRTKIHTGVKDEHAASDVVKQHRKQLEDLQEIFYATQQNSILVVLQGMDTAGKDGTIRHIFSGINPQGCDVASFKVPTPIEQRHDFLWRCHQQVPARGIIGIFNRSHYEDVLSPRVHGQITKKTARERMQQINDWEQMLVENGTVVLKFFLHISQEEQTERLQARIDTPEKHWKLSPSDFSERLYWDGYVEAYEDILRHTSKKHAPWFVIPADHKWYRDVAVSKVLLETMQSLKMKMPKPQFDPTGLNLDKETPEAIALKVKMRVNKGAVEAEHDSLTAGGGERGSR